MKYKISDYNGFMANVFGADCFVENFPEITTTGVELKRIGSNYYVLDQNGKVVHDSTFFSDKEMQYLEPTGSIFQKGFVTKHSFERAELRVMYNLVEKDFETFLNVASQLLADKEEENERLREEIILLKALRRDN